MEPIELLIPASLNQCYFRDTCVCFSCKHTFRCHYGCIECAMHQGMRVHDHPVCVGFDDISEWSSYLDFMSSDLEKLGRWLQGENVDLDDLD